VAVGHAAGFTQLNRRQATMSIEQYATIASVSVQQRSNIPCNHENTTTRRSAYVSRLRVATTGAGDLRLKYVMPARRFHSA